MRKLLLAGASAAALAGCVLPVVRSYLQFLGCVLLQVAVLLLMLSGGSARSAARTGD
jgi:hypothetical protein